MLDVYYCKHCRDKLYEAGEFAAEFLDEIQQEYLLTKETIDIPLRKGGKHNEMIGVIKYLESEGYLVSVEVDNDWITLKPLGIRETNRRMVELRSVLVCYDRDHGLNG